MTGDTQHVAHDTPDMTIILFYIFGFKSSEVLLLLSLYAHVERFSVSRMQDLKKKEVQILPGLSVARQFSVHSLPGIVPAPGWEGTLPLETVGIERYRDRLEGTLVAGTQVEGTLVEDRLVEGTLSEGPLVEGTLVEGTLIEKTLVYDTLVEGILEQGTLVESTLVEGTQIEDILLEGTLVGGHTRRGHTTIGYIRRV